MQLLNNQKPICMEQNPAAPQDLLDIYENNIVRADTGKRLANYIIDLVLFYVIAIGVGVVLAIVSPSTLDSLDDTPSFGIVDRIITLFLYALYMFAQEALFKGKSLGKLITGTRAVNLDGSPISATTAFLRGLSRAVPFCAFSAFGSPCNPWQDRWTDTLVMDEKKSAGV
jgi:uncharacterized RDD family membrane protein YckC